MFDRKSTVKEKKSNQKFPIWFKISNPELKPDCWFSIKKSHLDQKERAIDRSFNRVLRVKTKPQQYLCNTFIQKSFCASVISLPGSSWNFATLWTCIIIIISDIRHKWKRCWSICNCRILYQWLCRI